MNNTALKKFSVSINDLFKSETSMYFINGIIQKNILIYLCLTLLFGVSWSGYRVEKLFNKV